jgi:hypothetical protein
MIPVSSSRFQVSTLAGSNTAERERILVAFQGLFVQSHYGNNITPEFKNQVLGIVRHALNKDETGQFQKLLQSAIDNKVKFNFFKPGAAEGLYNRESKTIFLNQYYGTNRNTTNLLFGEDQNLLNNLEMGSSFIWVLSHELGHAYVDNESREENNSKNEEHAVDLPAYDIVLSVFPEIGADEILARSFNVEEINYRNDYYSTLKSVNDNYDPSIKTEAISLFKERGFQSVQALDEIKINYTSNRQRGLQENVSINTDDSFNRVANEIGWWLNRKVLEQRFKQ